MDDEAFHTELQNFRHRRRQQEAHTQIDNLLDQRQRFAEEYLRASGVYHDESRTHARRMSALDSMTDLLGRLTEVLLRIADVPAEHRRSHYGFRAVFKH